MKSAISAFALLGLLILAGAAFVWFNGFEGTPSRWDGGGDEPSRHNGNAQRRNGDAPKCAPAVARENKETTPRERNDQGRPPEKNGKDGERQPDPPARGTPAWSVAAKIEGPVEYPPVLLRAPIDRPLPTNEEIEECLKSKWEGASYVDRKNPDSPPSLSMTVKVRDLETGDGVRDAIVEVWGDNQQVPWRARTGKGGGTSILFPFDRAQTYTVRAVQGARIGISLISERVGFGPFGYSDSSDVGERSDHAGWFGVRREVWIWSPNAQKARSLHIADSQGIPTLGCHLWWYGCWMGTSDKNGIIAPPLWGTYWNEAESGTVKTGEFKFRQRFILHLPGYVPLFISRDDIAQTDQPPIEVCLRAPELVATIFDGVGPDFHAETGTWLSALVELKKDANVSDEKSLKDAKSGASPNYLRSLSAVLGIPSEKTWPEDYGWWYCKQWLYDARAGRWDVVLPYAGKFALLVGHQVRNGAREEVYLYIDATDPGNVTGKVYAVQR